MKFDEGIHTMRSDVYHASPCPGPALSASTAKAMLNRSPKHAWTGHPVLNPEYKREEEGKFALGTACHEYVLEGKESFRIVDALDWRSKNAKAERDIAHSLGLVAILPHQYDQILQMAGALHEQLDQFEDNPRPFTDGQPEQTLIWQEGDIWLKARCDWLFDDHLYIDDYKTTKASAEPAGFARKMLFSMDYDLQAAFYLRGLKHLTGIDAEFRFIVQEDSDPFGVSVIGLSPAARCIAEKKVQLAIDRWTWCVQTNEWPLYETRTCYVDPPAWLEYQVLEMEEAEEKPSQAFSERAG